MTLSTQGTLMTRNEQIVIRSARNSDEQAIAVLGVLDGGSHMPKGDVMVAEVDGRLRAAVGSNGAAISDPFWPSEELVSMLRVRAASKPVDHPARFFARRASLRVAAGGLGKENPPPPVSPEPRFRGAKQPRTR